MATAADKLTGFCPAAYLADLATPRAGGVAYLLPRTFGIRSFRRC